MKTQQYCLYAAAIATMYLPNSLRAQSCNTTLTNLQTWITAASPGQTRQVSFSVVSNRSDGTLATYAENSIPALATLEYSPIYQVVIPIGFGPPIIYKFPYANLQGGATQYFSNHRFDTAGGVNLLGGAPFPFNPLPVWFGTGFQNSSATANLSVTISLSTSPNGYIGPFGTVTLTSGSGPRQSFMPSCQDGILYGFVTDTKGTTLYAMNLVETEFDTPR